MAKRNHGNRFFKVIKNLEEALYGFGWQDRDENDVRIMTWYTHENHESDCIKREDGLWESKPESYGRDTRKFIFIWREHPNYCCAGKPYYSHNEVGDFLANSETEKVLYTHGDFEFVWLWEDVTMPTNIVWGMRSGSKYYQLRHRGEVLVTSKYKGSFTTKANAAIAKFEES